MPFAAIVRCVIPVMASPAVGRLLTDVSSSPPPRRRSPHRRPHVTNRPERIAMEDRSAAPPCQGGGRCRDRSPPEAEFIPVTSLSEAQPELQQQPRVIQPAPPLRRILRENVPANGGRLRRDGPARRRPGRACDAGPAPRPPIRPGRPIIRRCSPTDIIRGVSAPSAQSWSNASMTYSAKCAAVVKRWLPW